MSANQTDLFSCTVNRRLRGIEFKLKSVQIEEAMRLVSGGRTRATEGNAWGITHSYALDMGTNGIPAAFPGFTIGRFDLWGSKELLLNRAPNINLSPLLAVGLGQGVTINVPTVISETQLNQYLDGLKAAVRQFYIDFLKESECKIRIYTEECV